MNQLQRLQQLAGKDPHKERAAQLASDLNKLTEEYTLAMIAAENGQKIDEGFFTSLKAVLQTAGQVGTNVKNSVVDKAKKMTNDVIELYKDNKAQAELKVLLKQLKPILDQFDALSSKCPTIFKNDPDLAKDLTYFRDVFGNLISLISGRLQIKEDIDEANELLKKISEIDVNDSSK